MKAFAANWNHGRIDILAHNAGITLPPHGKEFTEDGYEYLYQVNILSSFLLTGLLDSEGKLAEDLRVLFTSSVSAYESSIPDDFSVAKTQLKVRLNRFRHLHCNLLTSPCREIRQSMAATNWPTDTRTQNYCK